MNLRVVAAMKLLMTSCYDGRSLALKRFPLYNLDRIISASDLIASISTLVPK